MFPKPTRPERGTAEDAAWMGKVAELACVICAAPGPSIVHHCISGRFARRRASDKNTIPLCWRHHDEQSPDGIHHSKEAWEALHGPDTGFLERVRLWIGMP